MPKLILCRHGQSEWNAKNLFTGWADVELSEQGYNEARISGEKLLKQNIEIDVVYTSLLTRAIETTYLLLKHSHQLWIPVYKTWRLNERHYGGLQGKIKIKHEKNMVKNKCIFGDVLMIQDRQKRMKSYEKNT